MMMARADRLIDEFRRCRGPFPYKDLVKLLNGLGYRETSTAGGSRRRFVHAESGHIIRLHEPHPGNQIKEYMVRQIRAALTERGLL
jgi:predicted RNA binding protein YcfA (HicA-like mRNA interferase family)